MIRTFKNKMDKNYIIFIFASAFLLNIFIEILGRTHPLTLLEHIFVYPFFFLYNILLIATTLSISAFFKRKKFALFLISVFWIALGIGNFFTLTFRVTPMAIPDLMVMEWTPQFMKSYITVPILIGVPIIVAIVVFLIVTVYKNSSKTKVEFKKTCLTLILLILIAAGINRLYFALDLFEYHVSIDQATYEEYGFAASLLKGVTERGIEEPEEYSEEVLSEIIPTTTPEIEIDELPNIIVVQLESFVDPTIFLDTEYSENPIPTFTYLMENYSSGGLDVCVLGGGTANTEFEVLTGMNLEFFGTGEYPYMEFLQEQTCESVAFNLSDLGYTTYALHNNTATFYERNLVYPNLGFDYFISSEFMTDVTRTEMGWIEDICLIDEITKCLDNTEEQDFVFTVSVQGHGNYPTEEYPELPIKVESSPFDNATENELEYYVNQLYEMDQFISELLADLTERDENTIVVFYGDHLPPINMEEEYVKDSDQFETQYVIWANYEIEETNEDLETFQLLANTLEKAGISAGTYTIFHQENDYSDPDYLENLQTLQYDSLYGENFSTDGDVFEAKDMQMGIGDIIFTVANDNNYYYILSEDLTEDSYIYIDDKEIEIENFENGIITIDKENIEDGSVISIKQISHDGEILYTTEEYLITGG